MGFAQLEIKVKPLPCELSLQLTVLRRWADEVLEEGALVDEFELPAVQLRSEPAATALAAAQAARASKKADAQRLGGALQRARQKDETIGPFLAACELNLMPLLTAALALLYAFRHGGPCCTCLAMH